MAEDLGETGAAEDGVGTSKQVKMGEHGGGTRVSCSARGCAIRVGPNDNRSVEVGATGTVEVTDGPRGVSQVRENATPVGMEARVGDEQVRGGLWGMR